MINVIIPLAGKGSRFKALSIYNKSLLPYKNKEILSHIIENLKKHTNLHINFVLNSEQKVLEDFIKKNVDNYTISYQSILNGPLGAISSAIDYIDIQNPTLIYLGDILTFDPLDFSKDFISVQEVPDYSRWCMVDNQLNFYDKPVIRPNTNLALSGLYYFKDSTLLKSLVKDVMSKEKPLVQSEYQISQVLSKYAKEKPFELRKYKIIDIGTIEDFLTNTQFKSHRDFHSIVGGISYVSKRGNTTKLTQEYTHLTLLKKFGWLIPDFEISNIKNTLIEIRLSKIQQNSLDYEYIFENHNLEYFESLFRNIILNLKSRESKLTDINKNLYRILIDRELEDLKVYLNDLDLTSVVTHGDYHLSNMFDIDGQIFVIDPSGRNTECVGYDLAKLLHSIIYDYNLIKFNLYRIKSKSDIYLYNEHLIDRKNVFLSILKQYYNENEIKQSKIICMLLFKTMQSLHSNDDHNQAFQMIHKKLKEEIDAGDFEIHIPVGLI